MAAQRHSGRFTVPDFAPGAVMYQIFPDRFARSGSCDLTCKLQPFWVHESPDELPEYRPDVHGEVRNNDFFGGNFAGICEKLPYLQELGVGVLYLNPISWRGRTTAMTRPTIAARDPMLGTEEDFRTLCDEAHARGMRVILDGVFSHTAATASTLTRSCVRPRCSVRPQFAVPPLVSLPPLSRRLRGLVGHPHAPQLSRAGRDVSPLYYRG